MNKNSKRWSVVNKRTGTVRTIKATRSDARTTKRSYERIFDNSTGKFVR